MKLIVPIPSCHVPKGEVSFPTFLLPAAHQFFFFFPYIQDLEYIFVLNSEA